MSSTVKARDLASGHEIRYSLNLRPEPLQVIEVLTPPDRDTVTVKLRRMSGYDLVMDFHADEELAIALPVTIWACTYMPTWNQELTKTYLVMREGTKKPRRSEVCEVLGLEGGMVFVSHVCNLPRKHAEMLFAEDAMRLPSLPLSV
jgi:hypothetical protein